MRVHDINIVADLNAHDPTVVNPCDVELDGTLQSSTESIPTSTLENILAGALSRAVCYWDDLWPKLHYEYESPESQPEVYMHYLSTCSLLHEENIEIAQFPQEILDRISSFGGELAEFLIEFLLIQGSFQFTLYMWRSLEGLPVIGLGALAVAIVAWMFSIGGAIIIIDYFVDNGWDVGWAAAAIFIHAFLCLYIAFGNILLNYTWMIIVGLAWPAMLFTAYQGLVVVCTGTFFTRFVAFTHAVAFFWMFAMLILYGGLPF